MQLRFKRDTPLETRFWTHVDKDGPIHPICGQCWMWNSIQISKPGQISANGIKESAHRVSWELHNGLIPDGLFVLHHCDNPRYVNPEHLFLGTQDDNMKDMADKNRGRGGGFCSGAVYPSREGEKNDNAKLTKKDVEEIRFRYRRYLANRSNARSLANEFGVSHSQIKRILSGKQWKQ